MFRELHTFMQGTTKGRGRIEVLSFAVTAEGTTADEFAQTAAASSTGAGGGAAQGFAAAPAPPHAHGGFVAAPIAVPVRRAQPVQVAGGPGAQREGGGGGGDVVYRGLIASMPDAHESRRERFKELDDLQPGWEVELRSKGEVVEAVFYAPGSGQKVGAFANARRMALAAHKAAQGL